MPRSSTKMKSKAPPKRSLLPLWLALAGLGLVLLAGWAVLSGRPARSENVDVQGAARLKVETGKIDHGDVKLGVPISDSVRVTNTGDQPLRFSEAPYIEVLEGC